MAFLWPYVGYEGPRRKHPAIVAREKALAEAARKNRPTHHPRKIVAAQTPEPPPMLAPTPMPRSLWNIMLEVCTQHRVTPAEIAAKNSTAPVVQARRVFAIRAFNETAHSPAKIGMVINKDRTTILHFLRQGKKGCSLEPSNKRVKDPRERTPKTELSEAEAEFARLDAQGLSNVEIGEKMGASQSCVRNYRYRVKLKRALAAEQGE